MLQAVEVFEDGLDCFGVLIAWVLGKSAYKRCDEGNVWPSLYNGEHYGCRHSLVSLIL